jgi:hypothetical protein
MFNLPRSLWSTWNISLCNIVYNRLPLTTSSVLSYQKQNPLPSAFRLTDFMVFPAILFAFLFCLHLRITWHRQEEQNSNHTITNTPSPSVQSGCAIEMNCLSSSGLWLNKIWNLRYIYGNWEADYYKMISCLSKKRKFCEGFCFPSILAKGIFKPLY